MTTKRRTKAQKEEAQKAALLQRVMDIYAGANGCPIDSEEPVFPSTVHKVMSIVNTLWVEDNKDREYLVKHWNVDEYETPQKCMELLFSYGVRA